MVEEPSDFIGNILAKLINRKFNDENQIEKLKSWNMSVLLETDYYPVSLIFSDGIKIMTQVINNPTLVIKTTFQTIISIVKNETSPLGALFKSSIKMKGIFRHPRAAFQFYRLIDKILK